MRLLLDTECWLWSVREPDRLNQRAKELIDDPATELYLSVASIWEITIKNQIGKLPLPKAPEDYIPELLQLQQTKTLVITPSHIYQLPKLPLLHRDPFDRLLIAQALTERLTLLTADRLIRLYKPPLIWASRRRAKS
ncbi:MAG TPA: type II toxin-antitoxin system VapC family toxin [Pyrinomonadaceae bacterium]|nr:type II toxin-antitoxin system VapC family toxin [Pyrinomonadaceae bacterium]